jgi:hypothetical protein
MRRIFGWLDWLVVGGALTAIAISVTAGMLGLDVDQRWGQVRIGLLAAGLGMLGLVACMRLADLLDRRFFAKPKVSNGEMADASTTAARERSVAGAVLKWLGLTGFLVGIELLYVWFVSVGHWTSWPPTGEYYGMLADAFLHGQTALLVSPPPELAALAYPWPGAMRPGIPALGDMSYFGGRYYMYWGPAPGALAAIWQLGTGQTVGDEYIVFLSSSLVFVFSVLILRDLKRQYCPDLPAWLFGCGLVAVATVHPLLWNLNHPTIREAAIASGQAFFLAGLWFALPAIQARRGPTRQLVLAGTMWGLALASRLVLVGAVGLLAVSTFWGWRRVASGGDEGRSQSIRGLAALALPIVATLALLGFYNCSRFGSPLETGLRYQLSMIDLNRLIDAGLLFNATYLPSSLLYYLFAPLHIRATFPFVRPVFGELPLIQTYLARLGYPATHHVEDATGLLCAMPFLIASTICVGAYLRQSSRGIHPERRQSPLSAKTQQSHDPLRMATLLLAASLAAFAPTALYFWVATRFMLDFTPLLMLAATIVSWAVLHSGDVYPMRRGLLSLLTVLALVSTVCIALLLAITGPDARFDDLNPRLWGQLLRLFSP